MNIEDALKMSNHEGKKHLSVIDAVSTTSDTNDMRNKSDLSNKRYYKRNLDNTNPSSSSNEHYMSKKRHTNGYVQYKQYRSLILE